MGIGIPTTAAAGRAIRPCHASATVPCASLVRVVAATRQKVFLIQREAGHAKKTIDKALDESCTVVPRASYKRSF